MIFIGIHSINILLHNEIFYIQYICSHSGDNLSGFKFVHIQENCKIPRAHVSFGKRQDTKLWNNKFPDSKILGLSVLRRMHALA